MEITLGVPQFIILVLIFIYLVESMVKDGQPKEGEYNFAIAFLSAGIEVAILTWGGFF